MIRRATPSDFPQLVELGRIMHGESAYAGLPFDPEVLVRTLEFLLERGLVLVHESGGVIDGGILGILNASWFGPAKTASDLAVFVAPQARGGLIAARLVKHFVAWAIEQGAQSIYLGITTAVHPESTGRFYTGMGFQSVGQLYMRAANHVHRH